MVGGGDGMMGMGGWSDGWRGGLENERGYLCVYIHDGLFSYIALGFIDCDNACVDVEEELLDSRLKPDTLLALLWI